MSRFWKQKKIISRRIVSKRVIFKNWRFAINNNHWPICIYCDFPMNMFYLFPKKVFKNDLNQIWYFFSILNTVFRDSSSFFFKVFNVPFELINITVLFAIKTKLLSKNVPTWHNISFKNIPSINKKRVKMCNFHENFLENFKVVFTIVPPVLRNTNSSP